MVKQFIVSEEGQTATEYMLIISVIVIALISAAFLFYSPFKQGVSKLAADVKTMLDTGSYSNVKGLNRS